MSVNKVILIGNVGKDPEVRYLDTQTKVATITLATTERYKGKDGEMKEATEWHNIVAWRNTADIIEKYVHKGTQVYIEGKLKTRMYEQNGLKKYATDVVADTLQLLGKRDGANEGTPQARPQAQATRQSQPPVQPPKIEAPDDDLPF